MTRRVHHGRHPHGQQPLRPSRPATASDRTGPPGVAPRSAAASPVVPARPEIEVRAAGPEPVVEMRSAPIAIAAPAPPAGLLPATTPMPAAPVVPIAPIVPAAPVVPIAPIAPVVPVAPIAPALAVARPMEPEVPATPAAAPAASVMRARADDPERQHLVETRHASAPMPAPAAAPRPVLMSRQVAMSRSAEMSVDDDGRPTCTVAQLRRFIKSRPWVPMHELRRRFGIAGVEDDVTPIRVGDQRIYVGLPPAEGHLMAELLSGGDVGYELSLDPIVPIVVGVYPMRPVPRG